MGQRVVSGPRTPVWASGPGSAKSMGSDTSTTAAVRTSAEFRVMRPSRAAGGDTNSGGTDGAGRCPPADDGAPWSGALARAGRSTLGAGTFRGRAAGQRAEAVQQFQQRLRLSPRQSGGHATGDTAFQPFRHHGRGEAITSGNVGGQAHLYRWALVLGTDQVHIQVPSELGSKFGPMLGPTTRSVGLAMGNYGLY